MTYEDLLTVIFFLLFYLCTTHRVGGKERRLPFYSRLKYEENDPSGKNQNFPAFTHSFFGQSFSCLIGLCSRLIPLSFPPFLSRIKFSLMSFKAGIQTTPCYSFILEKLLLILLGIIKDLSQKTTQNSKKKWNFCHIF